jgi:hypothetical protein
MLLAWPGSKNNKVNIENFVKIKMGGNAADGVVDGQRPNIFSNRAKFQKVKN